MAAIRANCRKVICIGRNYADHITELNNRKPAQPFFFLKPTSSILPPPHKSTPILIPRGVKVHYEVELGLVIGRPTTTTTSVDKTTPTNAALTSAFKPLRNLRFSNSPQEAEREALNYISSFLLSIDLTARNVQDEAKRRGLPWTIAKGFDTFCPISNPISPSIIRDPHNVGLSLSVNGQAKQRDSTNLMLFRIPRILSDISKVMSLEEGDIVLTGTPKGVGPVVNGDVVECTLEVDGREIKEARLNINVVDAAGEEDGGYVFKET